MAVKDHAAAGSGPARRGRPRRLAADLEPLRTSRDFRLVFASRTVTLLGSQASEVALLVQARQLTGSAFAVGLLGAAELAPLAVFGLYGGVLADRLDRRRLIRLCEAGLGGCAVLLVINASLPHPLVWPLYLIAAAMMGLAALQRPSLDASVPRVVGREQLAAASALLALAANGSFMAGTALGGLLATWPGPLAVYAMDAASFVVSLAFLGRLGPLPAPAPAQRDAGRRPGGLRGAAAGVRYAGLRGRLAGVELLSYGLGPSAGQLRAGAVASIATPRVSLWSGGLLCAGAVAVICAALPGFVRYSARSASSIAR
jgi:MFS family permease